MQINPEKETASIKIVPKTRDEMWNRCNDLLGPKRGFVWEGVDLAFRIFLELANTRPEIIEAFCKALEKAEVEDDFKSTLRELLELLVEEKNEG